jgi:hypothetical protein
VLLPKHQAHISNLPTLLSVSQLSSRLWPLLSSRFDPEVKIKPKRLPLGFFSWLWPVLSYDEDEIIRMSGMDVAVFLRLLQYGM